jgi:hypothetical protein
LVWTFIVKKRKKIRERRVYGGEHGRGNPETVRKDQMGSLKQKRDRNLFQTVSHFH